MRARTTLIIAASWTVPPAAINAGFFKVFYCVNTTRGFRDTRAVAKFVFVGIAGGAFIRYRIAVSTGAVMCFETRLIDSARAASWTATINVGFQTVLYLIVAGGRAALLVAIIARAIGGEITHAALAIDRSVALLAINASRTGTTAIYVGFVAIFHAIAATGWKTNSQVTYAALAIRGVITGFTIGALGGA